MEGAQAIAINKLILRKSARLFLLLPVRFAVLPFSAGFCCRLGDGTNAPDTKTSSFMGASDEHFAYVHVQCCVCVFGS